MSTVVNFIVGATSMTEGYHWERIMLSALKDGTLAESPGAQTTLTITAPDGAKLILTGTFNVISATDVTGNVTAFSLLQDTQEVMNAAFSHAVDVESVTDVSGGDPTLDDIIEGLKVMYGSEPVTMNGSPQHEQMFGGLGDDTINGGDMDERITGYEGADSIDGGIGGWDDARYDIEDGSLGIIANLGDSDRTSGAVTVHGKHIRDTYGFMDTIHNINFVSGTAGDDVFFGRDGDGEFGDFADFVSGNAGADTFIGGTGGLGVAYDQADLESGGLGVVVNLDTVTKFGVASGHALDTFGDTDTLTNISWVAGSQKDDAIIGSSRSDHFYGRGGDDLVRGNGGNDYLEGDDGKDILEGKSGKDTLSGGLGRDSLTGGTQADQFVYFDVVESKAGSTKRDYITDFKHGTDKIHLLAIDANSSTGKNDAFKLDAEGTSHTAVNKGHIGWYQIDKAGTANDRTIINFNVDNDKTFEMSIELKGLVDLTKGDFIL